MALQGDRMLDGGSMKAQSLESEIYPFLITYHDWKTGKKKEIAVKDLRHYIPLLIMGSYDFKEEPNQKKVKGLWSSKPKDWPSKLPFCDPNNAIRSEDGSKGKPKKEALMEMCKFLVKKYQDSKGIDIQDKVHLAGVQIGKAVPTEEKPRYVINVTKSSVQVCDDDLWNPEQDLKDRVTRKLSQLKNKGILQEEDIGSLDIMEDMVNKIFLVRDQQSDFFIQTAHDAEMTLDICCRQKRLPERLRTKWKEFGVSGSGLDKVVDYSFENPDGMELDQLAIACEETVETTENQVNPVQSDFSWDPEGVSAFGVTLAPDADLSCLMNNVDVRGGSECLSMDASQKDCSLPEAIAHSMFYDSQQYSPQQFDSKPEDHNDSCAQLYNNFGPNTIGSYDQIKVTPTSVHCNSQPVIDQLFDIPFDELQELASRLESVNENEQAQMGIDKTDQARMESANENDQTKIEIQKAVQALMQNGINPHIDLPVTVEEMDTSDILDSSIAPGRFTMHGMGVSGPT